MRLSLVFAAVMAASPIAVLAQSASTPAPGLKPGDTWVFDRSIQRGTSGYTDQHLVLKVQRVDADDMLVGLKMEDSPLAFEDHLMGRDWSHLRNVDGVQTVTGRPFSFPMTVGKTWTASFVDPTRHGLQTSAEHRETYTVTGWEVVTTPAGTFHALKIESEDKVKAQFMAANGAVGGAVTTADGSTVIAHTDQSGPRVVYGENRSTFYYAPEVKYWVKAVQETYNSENVRTQLQTDTLISFKPAA